MNNKLVLNFSTLSTWSKGLIDKAVDCYFHKNSFDTPQMEAGRAFHAEWEQEILKTGKLHFGRTDITFTAPKCEHLIRVSYNDHWDLKGTMDCVDAPVLYEFKTGKTPALDFASTFQIPIYFLLNEMIGNPLERAILLHLNQYTNESEYVVVWNSPEKMAGARNFIETLAPEIETYWEEHNIPFNPDFYKKD
jgi:hypothetical protein